MKGSSRVRAEEWDHGTNANNKRRKLRKVTSFGNKKGQIMS